MTTKIRKTVIFRSETEAVTIRGKQGSEGVEDRNAEVNACGRQEATGAWIAFRIYELHNLYCYCHKIYNEMGGTCST
jgi:hypothetical protein